MTINNYGGGEVNIIAQFSTALSHGDRQCHATILVQQGAPLSLLLGTDVLPALGFHLVRSPLHGQATDIVTKKPIFAEDSNRSCGSSTQDLESAELERLAQIDISTLKLEQVRDSVNLIEVKVVHDTRIAAHYSKTVEVKAELNTENHYFLSQ